MGNCMSCKKCGKCEVFGKLFKKKKDKGIPKDTPTDLPKVLSIQDIDFCLLENGTSHHTSRFDVMTRSVDPYLVVRRGQNFLLDLTFNRPYDPETDVLSFRFTVADILMPSEEQGTLVIEKLCNKDSNDNKTWKVQIVSHEGNHLKVNVRSCADSVVGQWKIQVETNYHLTSATYQHSSPFYILFNPWCQQDTVYIEGEELREEYVLSDVGLIWRGSYNRLQPTSWQYAQYEKDILDCSLYLINTIGKVRGKELGNPISVSRSLSAAVNSNDDNGALTGNWSDNNSGGTAPTEWMGSLEILQQYYKFRKSVKYGQCWVFAGVLSTVCRSVGIPCRVVTNFSSAHDTEGSLTIDYIVDENGEPIKERNHDSVWNFHVWNEVWMKRNDLGKDYDGWQVIDATPQEVAADRTYRCGPASVAAIKRGEVDKKYENPFVFAEVNADRVVWRHCGEGKPLKFISKDCVSVGQFISTKAVGKMIREDITLNYKYPEKSREERIAVLNALHMTESLYTKLYIQDFSDIKIQFALRDDIKIGETFSVGVIVTNTSQQSHTLEGNLKVNSVSYTGKLGAVVKTSRFSKLVNAMSTEEFQMMVTFDEYFQRLVHQSAFNIICMAKVVDTNYEFFAQDDFRVRKPDIKIALKGGKAVLGQTIDAELNLSNPLPIPLKKGQFTVGGCGLPQNQVIRLNEDIAPGTCASASIKLAIPRPGKNVITAKFTSNELTDVDGHLEVTVDSS